MKKIFFVVMAFAFEVNASALPLVSNNNETATDSESVETTAVESVGSSYGDDNDRIGYWGLGFFSYDGGENYGLGFGFYTFNGFGLGFNARSNWKFSDHQNTYNADILLNGSLGIYSNDDVKLMITPEVGPSIGSRSVYDDGEIKEKFFIDGFVGLKAVVAYKKVVISAGYHMWAPKWKFGKEKADGFYAHIGICM